MQHFFNRCIRDAFLFAGGVCVIGAVASFFLPRTEGDLSNLELLACFAFGVGVAYLDRILLHTKRNAATSEAQLALFRELYEAKQRREKG